MSRRAKQIWKTLLKLDEVPESPDILNITEPRLASFLYDDDCEECGTRKGAEVDFNTMHRFCKTCRPQFVSPGYLVLKEIPDISSTHEIYALVPGSNAWWSDRAGYDGRCYDSAILSQVAQDYFSYPEGSTERNEFVEKRKDIVAATRKYTYLMCSWHSIRARKLRLERKQREDEFEKCIAQKLVASGYESSEFPTDDGIFTLNLVPEWSKLVRQDKVLNPRAWNALFPKLEVILRDERTRRRKKELRSFYYRWLLEKEYSTAKTAVPTSDDICKFPAIRHLIRTQDGKVPITKEQWEAVSDILPDEITAYRARIEQELGKKYRDAYILAMPATRDGAGSGSGPVDELLLRSATAFLKCNARRHGNYALFDDVGYPGAMCHRHSNSAVILRSPCQTADYVCDPFVVRIAFKLLDALELPRSTSMDFMTDLRCAFVCLSCKRRTNMSWPRLVFHYQEKMKYGGIADLARVERNPKAKAISHDIYSDQKLAMFVTSEH